jgi:hypothetical protein
MSPAVLTDSSADSCNSCQSWCSNGLSSSFKELDTPQSGASCARRTFAWLQVYIAPLALTVGVHVWQPVSPSVISGAVIDQVICAQRGSVGVFTQCVGVWESLCQATQAGSRRG